MSFMWQFPLRPSLRPDGSELVVYVRSPEHGDYSPQPLEFWSSPEGVLGDSLRDRLDQNLPPTWNGPDTSLRDLVIRALGDDYDDEAAAAHVEAQRAIHERIRATFQRSSDPLAEGPFSELAATGGHRD